MPPISSEDGNFHTFTPDAQPVVSGALNEWIPRLQSSLLAHYDYWSHHLGAQWFTVTSIEEQLAEFDDKRPHTVSSVKVDVRVPGFARARDCLAWTHDNFGSWMLSAAMLCRISPPNPRLRSLHLRLSAHAEMYRIVESIISGSVNITDIVIEDDSHPELDGLPRPMLDLSCFAKDEREAQYAQLERLIVRAPALRINAVEGEALFGRLGKATTICFAVYEVITRYPLWAWTLSLLARSPAVQQAEICVADINCQEAARYRSNFESVHVPALKHLSLDLPQVDIRLLERLLAPTLKYVQVHSRFALGTYGDLPMHHFPELFCVTIWCPGGAPDRFKALGLRRRQYIHNIPQQQRTMVDADEPILIYVVKPITDGSMPDLSSMERPSKRMRAVQRNFAASAARQTSV